GGTILSLVYDGRGADGHESVVRTSAREGQDGLRDGTSEACRRVDGRSPPPGTRDDGDGTRGICRRGGCPPWRKCREVLQQRQADAGPGRPARPVLRRPELHGARRRGRGPVQSRGSPALTRAPSRVPVAGGRLTPLQGTHLDPLFRGMLYRRTCWRPGTAVNREQ